MKLSVVIPVFNAEKSVEPLVNRLFVDLHAIDFEVVLVNDGSKDNSEAICTQLAANNKRVKFISLSKNFGEHNAVLCGLNFTSGDYVVIMDDDFQNPPAEVPALLNEIEKGYDVVYSKYHTKKHSFLRNALSRVHNAIANMLMDKPANLYLSSFKIISQRVVTEIIKYQGPFPYIDGLIMQVTDNVSSVYVVHAPRAAGNSNYTLRKLFVLFLSMVISISAKPGRWVTVAGKFVLTVATVLATCFIISDKVYGFAPGYIAAIWAILLVTGFEIMFLALMAAYMGKQYTNGDKSAQWVIKEVHL